MAQSAANGQLMEADASGMRVSADALGQELSQSLGECEPSTGGEKGDAVVFEVRLTPNKGYGLFAVCAIKRGTCIFEEPSLVALPSDVQGSSLAAASLLFERMKQLSDEQREAYDSLHYDMDAIHPMLRAALGTRAKEYAIFETNAVSIAESGNGLFLQYSRINHSCTPNTYHCYNELRRWGFDCDCEACKGPSAEASNKRRQRIDDIAQTFAYLHTEDPAKISSAPARYRAPQSTAGRLRLAKEFAGLLKEEGLADRQLGDAYHWCSEYCLQLNQLDEAMAYVQEALDIQRACVGVEYKPTSNAEVWVAKVRAAVDEKQESARRAEEQHLQEEKIAAEKDAYEAGKKAWEAAKKATKKDKRLVRGAAHYNGLFLLLTKAIMLYELRSTPNKGYGLYALQDIPRGTLIFEEVPLVTFPPNTPDTSYLFEGLKKLTAEESTTYYSLHFDHQQAGASENEKAISIFRLNCVRLGKAKRGSGVFAQYSRINHSCTPNVANGHHLNNHRLTVHAMRDIKSGEELTSSYIDISQPAEQRAKDLRPWTLECKCTVCDVEDVAESDGRRQRMRSILKAFEIMVEYDEEPVGPGCEPITPTERLSWAEELVELCKGEELVGKELWNAYSECARWAIVLGRRQEAAAFAEKATDVEQVLSGELANTQAHLQELKEWVDDWLGCEVAGYLKAQA
ncbi:hypothetical protein LTR85_008148 [Meristemomyces frigidus]|nr:hypothetical protein LTR85_008148 [Meristemomyces frigidus]